MHALALTKRHVGSVSEIVRNMHEHLNQLKCYLSFSEMRVVTHFDWV